VLRREELFQELRSPTLDRDALKGLFLLSLHGGNYRKVDECIVPFLEQFQSELRSCTRVLLASPRYADFKARVANHRNPLGSAIGLIAQLNESKVMAAKTAFTEERKLHVATDLFDGHLREIGALDLKACSKFVEEKTGLKVAFVTKPGTDVWKVVEPKAKGMGKKNKKRSRTFLLPTPAYTASPVSTATATFVAATTAPTAATASDTPTITSATATIVSTATITAATTRPSTVAAATPLAPTAQSSTATSHTASAASPASSAQATSLLATAGVCPSFDATCPKFKPILPNSLYCAACTHLSLCVKYSS